MARGIGGAFMGAVLQSNYLEPVSLKLQKHIKIFTMIVKSYPVNYFNMADILDLQEVSKLTDDIATQRELMRFNPPDSVAYDKAVNLMLRLTKQNLAYKNSLRITNNSRNESNRGKNPVSADIHHEVRDKVIEHDPFDSGVPNQ